jgi:hypothetical protein
MGRQAIALGEGNVGAAAGWQIVQPNRFRYAVEVDGRSVVKLALREYLGVEVRFAER